MFDKHKAEMLGYPPEKFSHYKDFMALVHPNDYDKTMDAMRGHIIGLFDKYEIDYRILTSSGNYKWFHDIGSIVEKDTKGKPSKITGLVLDITERKQVEQELEIYHNNLEELVTARTEKLNVANELLKRELEKDKEFEFALQKSLAKEKELNDMQSRFISTTSHEFRTPLTSALLSADLLQRYMGKWDKAKKDEHLNRIKKSISYLTELMDNVLTIGKAESGMLTFQRERLNLEEFVSKCIDEASNQTSKHSIELSYIPLQNIFRLDPKLMKFIISNLLSNAIKYSPKGGKVELSISTNEDHLKIEISDEGIGIPLNEMDHIFDSFYRTKNACDFPGTGLGLAIVKSAVDFHNGEITVVSKLNQGTTFKVMIPITAN